MKRKQQPPKQYWFESLNEALASEGLVEFWPGRPVSYGESVRLHVEDGSRYGRVICVYRSESGRYERPVSYQC